MASLTIAHRPNERPKNYFGLMKLVLKAVGVNIDGNDSAAYRIYSIVIILVTDIMYLIFCFLEIFKHDFTVVAEEMLMYLFAFFLASAKTIVVVLKRDQFAKLLNKLEQEQFLPNPNRGGELEEKLIKECIWLTTVQAITYWSVALACFIADSSVSLSKRLRSSDYHDWVFAYGPLTVLNVTYSPNFEITWVYQLICVFFFTIQFASIDLISAAVLAHITYQFRILQINLQRILPISYEKMLKETGSENLLAEKDLEIDGSVIPWKYLKESLVETVNYHLAIISVAEELESLLSGLLLTVFLSTLGLLCFLVYHTSLLPLGDPKLWSTGGEAILGCFQVAIICYWGEQAVFQSREVGRAAYESNFVGTDLRFQKALALIIRRSQNPTKLTAGKFGVIVLATFTWIIRTSYSAFMMLRNTQA